MLFNDPQKHSSTSPDESHRRSVDHHGDNAAYYSAKARIRLDIQFLIGQR